MATPGEAGQLAIFLSAPKGDRLEACYGLSTVLIYGFR